MSVLSMILFGIWLIIVIAVIWRVTKAEIPPPPSLSSMDDKPLTYDQLKKILKDPPTYNYYQETTITDEGDE